MIRKFLIVVALFISTSAFASWGSDDHSTNQDTEQAQGQIQGQIAIGQGGDARAYGGRSNADATGVGIGVGVGGEGGEGGDAYSGSSSVGINANRNTNRSNSDSSASNFNASYQGTEVGTDVETDVSNDNRSGAIAGAQNAGNNTSIDGDTYVSRNKAFALSLPAATPGVGASAPCLVTTRGATIVGSGWSGSTKIDSGCYEDLRIQKNFENCMIVADAYARLGNEHLLVSQLAACRSLAVD